MIEAVELKKGSKILYKGDPFEIIDFQHSIRGRGRGKVWLKMKNLKTGNVLEETFSSEENFELPDIETRDMQYLYEDTDHYTFMDNETFEQYYFPKNAIGDARWFLKEGEKYLIMLYENLPLNIDLPASFNLKIIQTEPAIKGDSVTNVTKQAVLETGLVVKVPLFISEGEIVKVDTRTLEYISRA